MRSSQARRQQKLPFSLLVTRALPEAVFLDDY